MASPGLVNLCVFICILCVHVFVIDCKNRVCSSKGCRRTACPTSCPCLGSLVDCSKRGLLKIPKDVPGWVELLDLQNNDISTVENEDLEGLWNLTEIDLSYNQLEYLNASILLQLTSLKKLIINKNRLVELPCINLGGRQSSLTTLSLQHNEIHSLNSSILEIFPKLQVLDLSFNNLVDLPANTFGYSSSLRHLSLSHNRIISLEKGVFDGLKVLESLKLNKNKLSVLPKEVFRHLKTLHHLEMNSNNFTQIEGLSFQGLGSLSVLKLRLSGILHLADGAFYGLNAIKKLQLDYNGISKIRKGWLYGLNSLQRLYLNNNNISEIEDDAWDSGKRLIELDLTHNSLQFITVKTFDKLYSLKRLILSDNMITYIEEGSFHSLSALQYLELRNNEVSWTIEEDTSSVFAGLERLRYLGLANNKIKAVVRRAFSDLSRLQTLNLTLNRVTTIEKNAFDDMPQLQSLAMNTSSLLCDCNLAWMRKNFHFPIIAKCGYPPNLQGLSIFDISVDDFVCGKEGSPKPVIVKQPYTKITLKGENVTLECQAHSSGNFDTKFQWRKDGKLLQGMRLWSKNTNTRNGNSTLHTSVLFIENIQNNDEGRYQCVIANRFGSSYSNKAGITVHVYPVFTKVPVDVSIKSGSTARLECGAKGQPTPDVAWRKDGGSEDFPAARERRMHVMLPTDDIFFIVDVKVSDAGVYSCTAENVAGVITANATLTVLETPSFVKRMEDKETRAGETAVLECRAAGSPTPNLTWTKDGGPLVATERHFFTAGNQLLIIVEAKPTDSGVYSCEMSNSLGTERGSSHLRVLPATQGGSSGMEENNMTGIIVIAVVVCVVGTSIVWVIVIHHTRKTRDDFVPPTGSTVPASEVAPFSSSYRAACSKELKHSVNNLFLDSHSGHSKDSGTGDSAQPSNDDLLIEDDDHGLLLDVRSSSKVGGGHHISSLLALHDGVENCRTSKEPYASSSSSMSKEQVPLLHPFRTSRNPWKSHRKSIAEFRQQNSGIDRCTLSYNETKWPCILAQRSLSADQVNCSDGPLHHRGCSEPPHDIIVKHVDSDEIERDSGFSTFPRSITQASVCVSSWSSESPRMQRLPNDIPNDSGSFSIANEEVQMLSVPVNCLGNNVKNTESCSRTSKVCTVCVDQKA